MQNMDTRQMQGEATKAMGQAEDLPDTLYLGAVAGSIVLSLLLFIARRKEMALFVGLWPPTILNLVMLMKQRRPAREMARMQAEQGNSAAVMGDLMAE
jgi:hypothetical protein